MRRDLILISLFIILSSLPFINKAFHIDDWSFILIAKNIELHPFDPYHGEAPFLGETVQLFTNFPHPPLLPYILKGISTFAGWDQEYLFHLIFIIFSLIAGISFYFVSRRFVGSPFISTLLFIATPAIFVNSGNIMSDVPAIAFFLLSLVLFIEGIERDKEYLIAISGIFIGICIMIRYSNLFIFLLMGLYCYFFRVRPRRLILPFSIAFTIFILWTIQNIHFHGRPHILSCHDLSNTLEGWQVLLRTITGIVHLGGATIFPLLLILPFFHNLWGVLKFFLIWVLGAILINNFSPNPSSINQVILCSFFLAVGLFLIIRIAGNLKENSMVNGQWSMVNGQSSKLKAQSPKLKAQSPNIFLSAWLLTYLLLSILFLPFAASRYLIPLIPPLVILFIYTVENTVANLRLRHAVKVGSVILTLLLAILIATSDYIYAGVYREISKEIGDRYHKESTTVWYNGEWGLRNYMTAEGFGYLLSDGRDIGIGDIIIRPRYSFSHEMTEGISLHLKTLDKRKFNSSIPIRTMNYEAFCGFYSSMMGLMPFSFSTDLVEEFVVSRVAGGRIPYLKLNSILPSSRVLAPQKNYVYPERIEINGEIRPVLFQHPPSKVYLDILLPRFAVLSIGLGLSPKVWDTEGDGMTFRILVKRENGSDVLFNKNINPTSNPSDRRWFDFDIDLNRYGGERVELILETDPGEAGDNSYDWGGWSEPEIFISF